jgi:hypothetical protein
MSLTEFNVIVEKKEVLVTVQPPKSATIQYSPSPNVIIIAAGNVGPRGASGQWVALTQNEYDLLNPPDPETLYVIIQ